MSMSGQDHCDANVIEGSQFAYNIELAYFPANFFQFAVRVEHSQELDGNPEWQYGVSGAWAIWENLTASADYLYGRYKNRFVSDGFNNTQTAHHIFAFQLTWGF